MNTPADFDSRATASRRTVLLAGAAVVTGSVLLRNELGLGNGGLTAMAALPGPRISVGYIQGSSGADSLATALAGGSGQVVPASSLRPAGLGNQPATLVVHGFTPGAATDASSPYSSVLVDAHIPSPDRFSEDATIPFYAWTFRRAPAPMASGRSRFVIAPSRGLRVGFSVAANAAPPSTVVFTSGSEGRLPKLQPGVYVLGMEPDVWRSARRVPAFGDGSWSDLVSMVVSVHSL